MLAPDKLEQILSSLPVNRSFLRPRLLRVPAFSWGFPVCALSLPGRPPLFKEWGRRRSRGRRFPV